MSTSVPSPHKSREPFLDRPFEEIRSQILQVVNQRPGLELVRLAVICNLPIVGNTAGRVKKSYYRRLGIHTQALIERLVEEGAIELTKPSDLYPKERVFPAGYQPKPQQVTVFHYGECRTWVDPSYRGRSTANRLPNGRERLSSRAHFDEAYERQFGEKRA